MSEIERHNPTPELPSPPELDRQTYDSLVRVASHFASTEGEPLYIASNKPALTSSVRPHTWEISNESGATDALPLNYIDESRLFRDARKFANVPKTEIGRVSSRFISASDMPFEVDNEGVEVRVATFNEASSMFMDQDLSGSDLDQAPLVMLSLSFEDFVGPDHAGYLDSQELISFLITPPNDEGVAQSLRVREYYGFFSNREPKLSSKQYEFMNSLTANHYAVITGSSMREYDFASAAFNLDILKKHQDGVSGYEELPEWWGDENDGFIGGHLLTGYIGREGAENIQQIIELASQVGKPVDKA